MALFVCENANEYLNLLALTEGRYKNEKTF